MLLIGAEGVPVLKRLTASTSRQHEHLDLSPYFAFLTLSGSDSWLHSPRDMPGSIRVTVQLSDPLPSLGERESAVTESLPASRGPQMSSAECKPRIGLSPSVWLKDLGASQLVLKRVD